MIGRCLMDRRLVTLFGICLILLIAPVASVVSVAPSDENFTDNAGDGSLQTVPSSGRTVDGITYFTNDPGDDAQGTIETLNVLFGDNSRFPSKSGSDRLIYLDGLDGSGAPAPTMIGFKDADGDLFQLDSVFLSVSDGLVGARSENFRIEGYDSGGNVVVSDTVDMTTSDSSGSISYTDAPEADYGGTLTFDSNWEAITEVRFVGTDPDVGTTNAPSFILDDINFEPAVTNAAPTLPTNNGLTVDEGSSANAITTAELNASDTDGDTLTYDVTSGVSSGKLFVDGSGAGSDDGTLDGESAIGTGSFMQAAIDDGNLLYSHDGSATTSDGFDFDLKDGNGGTVTGQTFTITVTEAPTVTSITRGSPTSQETNVDSVTYDVTFSESVSGVDSGDFSITDNAGGTAAIVSVVEEDGNADGDDIWEVTVNSITGDGQLRLDLSDDDGITSDSNSVPLGGVGTSGTADGSYTSGNTYSIDNTAPGFDSGASASMNEGTTGNVLDVEAGDDGTANPNTNVDYTLSGTDAAGFSIDTDSGQLSLGSALDFENPTDADTNNDYELTVTATDDAGNTAEQSVTVSTIDVNEAPTAPTDSDGAADVVAETASNGAAVGVDAETTDPEDDTISWSLDDDASGRFDIDSNGQITVADTIKLDYETSTSHTITINASDGSLSARKAITISVEDGDETPTFVSGTSTSVSETATGGASVQDVNATVGGVNDTGVSYQFTSGNGDSAYAIDNTGKITVNDASKVDFENSTSRTVTVEASEGTARDTQTITISVTDVDETPSFTSGPSDSIAEDASNGDSVHDVDADVGGDSDAAVSYTITGGNGAGAFSIDGNTGGIDVADESQFDFEGTNSFSLTVEASEGTATNTQTVSISVTDVDEKPVFASVGAQTVNESATAGTNVVDIDADVNKTGDTPVDTGVSYTITAGNEDVAGDGGGAFAIDSNTGQITVNDTDDFNRSAQSSFTLTIKASEGSQNVTQNVTISVVDDVAPTLTSSDPSDDSTGHVPGDNLTLTFDEPVSFDSGQITLRKNNSGFSDAETFDVTTDIGSSDGNISIYGSQLTINPTGDLVANTEYAVRIDATAINDTATTPNAFAGISNDDDLDFITADTKPSFSQATGGIISVSVTEDSTLDLTSALEVDDISASDTLTWSLPNGQPNASNGTISDLDTESVSYSSGASHTLTSGPEYVPNADFAGAGTIDDSFDVQINDSDGYTATATVEVDVQQVNDAPSVTLGDDRTVNGTTSQQTAANFASFGPGGGSDEAGQSVQDYTVTVASDPDGVLSAVDIDNDGNLTYTANDSVEGTATVAVAVQDDGGTANGGTNTSATAAFDITADTRSPTVDSASTTARTLTVTMDEPLSTAAANTPPGENFTVTADGRQIGVSDVAISGSTISLGLSNGVSFGEAVTLNYTRGTNITEDLATNQLANFSDQPVTNTIRRPNRGGGGGGGSDPDDTGPSVTVEPETEAEAEPSTDGDSETNGSASDDSTDSKSVSVRGVTAGERVSIDLSGTATERSSQDESTGDFEDTDSTESDDSGASDGGESDDGGTDAASERPRNVVADGLDIQFAESGDYDLTVRTRDAETNDNTVSNTAGDGDADSGLASRPDLSTNSFDDEGRRFARETRQRPVGFIQVDTQFEEEAVETATHRFRVRKSYLESTGASVESVRLYRDEVSQWRELETRQVGATEEYYFFEADTPGFSVFAIGTTAPVFEKSTPTLTSFNETTGEVTATVTVENIGNKSGVFASTLIVDGTQLSTVEREIAAGETAEIPVSGVIESTGTMTVRFAGQSLGEVTRGEAAPESSSVWLPGLVVGVIVILGFLWRRRTNDAQ